MFVIDHNHIRGQGKKRREENVRQQAKKCASLTGECKTSFRINM